MNAEFIRGDLTIESCSPVCLATCLTLVFFSLSNTFLKEKPLVPVFRYLMVSDLDALPKPHRQQDLWDFFP